MHKTSLGSMSGSLIIANAYCDLELQANRFHPGMFFYLLFVFSIFSYLLFYGSITDLAKMRARYHLMGLFPKKHLQFSFFLLLTSIINFLLFGTHISVVIPGLYLAFIWYMTHHFRTTGLKERVIKLAEGTIKVIKLPHT